MHYYLYKDNISTLVLLKSIECYNEIEDKADYKEITADEYESLLEKQYNKK